MSLNKVKLENMLFRLCDAQDEVTRLKEANTTWGLRKAKDKRDEQMRIIVEAVMEKQMG